MILERLVVAIDSNLQGLQKGLRTAARDIDSFDKKATQFGKGFATAATATAAATVALGEFTAAGGRTLAIQQAFTARVGDQARALGLLRRATRDMVSDAELMTQANVALTLGSAENIQQFATLAETAQQLGRALGLDTAFALNSLNVGIARQSRLVLDNVGLIVSAADASEKYAESLGITADQLTDVQQKEAFRVEAMEQARLKIEELGGVALNAGDAWIQLRTEISNVVSEMQLAAAESGTLRSAFEGFRDVVRELRGGGSGPANAIMDSLRNISDPRALMDRATEFIGLDAARADPSAFGGIDAVNDAFKRLQISGDDLDMILVAIATRYNELTVEAEAAARAARELREEQERLAREALLNTPVQRRTFTGQFQGAVPGFGGFLQDDASLQRARDRRLGSDAQLKALAEAIQKVADNLEPLAQRPPSPGGPGFLGSLGERLGGILDPQTIASNVAAGFATQGVSLVVSGLGQVLGNIFGGGIDFDAVMEENTRAIRANTEAILRTVRGTEGGLIGTIVGGLQAGLVEFAQGSNGVRAVTALADALRAAGFQMEDFHELVAELGIEFIGTAESFQQLLDVLAGQLFGTLSGRLSLARTAFELRDITDPTQQFRAIQAALAESLPAGIPGFGGGGLGLAVARLDPETVGQWASGILAQIEAGDFDLTQLGDVSLDAFLAALVQLESLGDAATDAAGALGDLARVINAPSGFKVNLARFRSTQVGQAPFATDLNGPPADRWGSVTFQPGSVVVQVSGSDPSAGLRVVDQVKRAMELEAARGGGDQLVLSTQLR